PAAHLLRALRMITVAEGVVFNDDGTVTGSLVPAARWVSMRRMQTLADAPANFSVDMAKQLLAELGKDRTELQERSAALTLRSHLCATVLRHPQFRAVADAAVQQIFAFIEAEKSTSPLRAHAILLLSLRGPALSANDAARAKQLLNGLVRA